MCSNWHVLVSYDNATKDVISRSYLTPLVPYLGTLILVGSCHGLVCFSVRIDDSFEDDDILLLWNPVTKKCRYLPKPQDSVYTYTRHAMEFCFVVETNDYVIVRVGSTSESHDRIRVSLYKMNTSMFVNGSFHWMACSNSNFRRIVSFDIKNEKLGLMKPVEDDKFEFSCGSRLYLAVIEESLAVMHCNLRGDLLIWVMTEYGVQDSWVLMFQSGNFIISPVLKGYWKTNFVVFEYNTLDLYDLSTRRRKKYWIQQQSEICNLTGCFNFLGTMALVER
ncbi:F-box/kelch-repeat protein At3g23880-like [Apium graveolens]|uniref:F-box/kelch-repeat protein At3g23880-like n=1 Tax=Apium graveolens TaxID=4045 RepID=UPI003D7B30DE